MVLCICYCSVLVRKSLKTKSSSVPVSVGAVNFCVDRTIIVSKSVDPVIGLRKDGCWWNRSSSSSSPHQVFQPPELIFHPCICSRHCLHDGRIVVANVRLWGGIQIVRPFESTDKVSPKPCLLSERNVLGVHIEIHILSFVRVSVS